MSVALYVAVGSSARERRARMNAVSIVEIVVVGAASSVSAFSAQRTNKVKAL